jgi:hypothetical protein
MWTFVRALETDRAPSRRLTAWSIHALVVALGAYAHNLLPLISVSYVITALFMRLPKRQFLAMALAYTAAAVLAIPAILLALSQERSSGGLDWIIPFWRATPPAFAIPKSLEILALGGNMPRYLLAKPLAFPLELLGILLVAGAVVTFFWPRPIRQTPDGVPAIALPISPRYRPLLIVFTCWPLLFLWAYSFLIAPLYLVGRYDLFAQPAYLLLLACGFTRMQSGFQSWRQNSSQTVYLRFPRLLILVSLIFAADLFCRWTFPLDPQIFHHRQRVDFLARNLQPADILICTGLEASPTLYYLRQSRIDIPLYTFPTDTLRHIGWLISDARILALRRQWQPDALALIAQAVPPVPGARIWIFLDSDLWNLSPDFAPSPRQQLTLDFIQTLHDAGWYDDPTSPDRQNAQSDLRIICLVRDLPSSN